MSEQHETSASYPRNRNRLLALTLFNLAVFVCSAFVANAQLILPVQWSTYLGGSGDDQMRALCVDRDDNVYVCGVFTSPDFPAARGVPTSYDTSRANGGGYLASFSPTGELRWLQYFGCVRPHEIAISDEGVLVMVGATAVECGRVDATISIFTPAGERLAQAYVLGGPAETDIATSVDIIGSTIYVVGITQSPDLQTTANAFQAVPQGGVDGFVAKLKLTQTPAGWQIVRDVVSYYGGRTNDEVLVVRARNTLGHVYIGGRTRSDNLPGNGVLQPTRLGTLQDDDGFVAKLDSTTLECLWYTYCGGTGNEAVYGLQPYNPNQPGPGGEPFTIRACGVYYGDFPSLGAPSLVTPFAGGTALGGDAFLLQIRESPLIRASTWNVGTSADDVLCSFTRGSTNTGPLLFSNGFFTCQNNTFNAYRLNPYPGSNPSGLSSFCGNNDELTLDVEQFRFGFGGIDEGPNSSYICGSTTSTSIPGTDAAGPVFQREKVGSNRNGFLAKIGCGNPRAKLVASASALCSSSDSATISLLPAPSNVVWSDGVTDPIRVIRASGTYAVTYTEDGCKYADSIVIRTGLKPSGRLESADSISSCDTSGVLLTIRDSERVNRIIWSNDSVATRDTTIRVREAGTYFATLFSPDGCTITTDTVTVVSSSSNGSTQLLLSYAGADSSDVGSTIEVVLRISAPAGTALDSLPTDWSAVARFDKTMLLPLRPLGEGITDDTLRSVRLSGRRALQSDTLGTFKLAVALGERDSTDIIIDSLVFDPCYPESNSVVLPFRTAGICRVDSVGRFITTRQPLLRTAVVSNPVGSDGAVGIASGGDLTRATARIITLLGEEIMLTILDNTGRSARWSIPPSLPSGRYLFVVHTGSAVASSTFEVVR